MWYNRIVMLSEKFKSATGKFPSPAELVLHSIQQAVPWIFTRHSFRQSVIPSRVPSSDIEAVERESIHDGGNDYRTNVSADTTRPTNVIEESRENKQESSLPYHYRFLAYMWRFSPDLIAIGAALSLSCIGDLCAHQSSQQPISNFLENMIIPFAFLLFLAVSFIQTYSSRLNFSRFFLELEILNQIGQASYPIYLIQNVLLQYYFTYFIDHGDYQYHPENPSRGYFRALPFPYRFGFIMLVLVIGWFVQKGFQEFFIAKSFTFLLSKWKQRNESQ